MNDLDAACAGLLCVGFEGHVPSPEVLELVRRGVYGVILFGRNVESPRQVAELSAALKRAAARPLLVTIDQEGGRVARLRARQGFTEIPPMRVLGATGDEALARAVGAMLGRELRAVGIDQDYAPVVDVDTNPASPVIGDRSFGADPVLVSRMGAALAAGLQSEGVAACAKHFPGHGDTRQDSHHDLPRLRHELARLEAVELAPFRALAKAGVASVMTAHVVFEAVDSRRPATMSPAVMRLLREHCGFDGAAISDDLEMKAVSSFFTLEEGVPAAIAAGVDGLLVCHTAGTQHRVIDILRVAVERGEVAATRLAEARGRIGRLVEWARPAPDPGGVAERLRTREHLALVERLPRVHAGRDPTA